MMRAAKKKPAALDALGAVMRRCGRFVLVGVLLSAPAWAQNYPARSDCDAITRELAMRPPAFGDKGRASYDYQSWLGFCQIAPWKGMVTGGDLEALRPLVCTHGGMVDHVNGGLMCY